MIIVIDYNVGNVRSVCKAFTHIGCEVKLSCDKYDIQLADGLVLPGVAAFSYAMKELGKTADVIKETALTGKPLLGICVGHQMLFEISTEYGSHTGLGLIKGKVIPLPAGRVIPHMGWNKVQLPEDMELFKGLGSARHFYFAHSFYADVSDNETKVAFTDYGFNLTAAVQKKSIYGTQFHPEKSGETGLNVLRNFADICRTGRC